jgi:hypothetical protein
MFFMELKVKNVLFSPQGSRVPEQHFIIAGAGISGLTSAYMLLSAGHEVLIQQKLGSAAEIFAAYAISCKGTVS